MGVRDLFFSVKARDETGAAFDRVRANLRSVDGMAASASKRFRQYGAGLATLGAGLTAVTAPLILAFSDSLQLYDDAARAAAKVETAVKSTGGAAGLSAEELFKVAAGLQDITRFDGDDVLNKVTAQLLTFTNIAGDNFLRAQVSALDLATTLDGDLQSASIMLGKALNDPIKGLSAMGKAGIQFSEDQKSVIAALVETGDLAGAQVVILEELEKQYGGQAAAAALAGMGAMDQLRNSWGDLKEGVGAVIADILPPMVDFFKGMISWFQALPAPIQKFTVTLGLIATVAGPAAIAIGALTIAVGALSAPFLLVGAAIAGAIALTVAFWPEIENIGRVAKETFLLLGADVADAIQSGIESVVGFGNSTINTFQGAFASIKVIWGALPGVIGDLVYSAANGLIGGIEAMLNAVTDRINGFIEGINSALALLPEWATGEGGISIGVVPQVKLGRITNEFEGAATAAAGDAQAAFDAAFKDNPFQAPDLGLTQMATDARAAAAAVGEVPPATTETVDALQLLTDTIPDASAGLGGLSAQTAGLGGKMKETKDKTEELKGVFDGLGHTVSDSLKSAFADGKLTLRDFGDFALSWADKLLSNILDSLFNPLGDALQVMLDGIGGIGSSAGGSTGGGSGGLFSGLASGIGGFIGNLMGFDTGGEMAVSGRNGIDRNVASFRVSADENIKVVKRGNPDSGRAVNVYIQTPNPNAFAASKGQIAADISRAVGHGARFT